MVPFLGLLKVGNLGPVFSLCFNVHFNCKFHNFFCSHLEVINKGSGNMSLETLTLRFFSIRGYKVDSKMTHGAG